MRHGWVSSSYNQSPLERALALIREPKRPQGRLIVVRSEAGAGASAFSSRLHQLLNTAAIRSAHVPRSALNTDFVLLTHLFRSLGLPLYSADIHSPRRASHPYVAALKLRQYQAIVFEDAHDFFNKHQQKIQRTYEAVMHMVTQPQGYNVVFCGLHDVLTVVGLRARGMGIEVEFLDLNPMGCDDLYQQFVLDTLKVLSIFRIQPSLEASAAVTKAGLPYAKTSETMDGDGDLANLLIPSPFAPPQPAFFTPHGIDTRALHAHSKGLIGKTVSALEHLKLRLQLDAASGAHQTMYGRLEPSAGQIQKIKLQQLPDGGPNHSVPAPVRLTTSGEAELTNLVIVPAIPSGSCAAATRQSFYPNLQPESDQAESYKVQMSLELGDTPKPQMTVQLELPFEHAHTMTAFGKASGSGPYPLIGMSPTSSAARATSAHATASCAFGCSTTPIALASRPLLRHSRSFAPFLKPVADETLGSWLSRNASASHVTAIHSDFLRWCTELVRGKVHSDGSGRFEQPLPRRADSATFSNLSGAAEADTHNVSSTDLIDAAWESMGEVGAGLQRWNPQVLLGSGSQPASFHQNIIEHDGLYGSPSFLSFFPPCLRHRLVKQFVLPTDATHFSENRRYCAQCIADDVAALRAPALRRAWRKRGAAVCIYHNHPVLLQKLEKANLSDFSGAWLAYTQHTQRSDYDHGTGLITRCAEGYQDVYAEAKICRVVRRIQDWVEFAPAQGTGSQPSKYALYFLLGFFLYQGNLTSEGGVARWFFKSAKGSRLDSRLFEKPTVLQMVANIESAAPQALAMAYLLIGCAFKLIRPNEHIFLRSSLRFTDCTFPSSRFELKALAQCFQDYHSIAVWESALYNLSENDLPHLEWLLRKY